MSTAPAPIDQLFGYIAYKAYCDHTGGVSAVSGQSLPEWDHLSPAIQNAWVASAGSVRDHIVSVIETTLTNK